MAERSRDLDAPVVVVLRSDGDDGARLASTLGDIERASVLRDVIIRVAAPAAALDELEPLLRGVTRPVELVVTENPLPFTTALAECRRGEEGRDIVVLTPGVRLPYAWDARLVKALLSSPDVAAVSPLCDASPLHAIDETATSPDGDFASIDRAVYCVADRTLHEVPRVHAACVMLRAKAVDDALATREETGDVADFLGWLCQRMGDQGRIAVLCDYLYVGFEGTLDAAGEARALSVEETAFTASRPVGRIGRGVKSALEAGLPGLSLPGLDSRPVVLHITHYWGGGTDRWVRDFSHDDSAHHLILATYRIGKAGGQRIVLYADARERVPVRTWDIGRPIEATLRHSAEYRRVLDEVVRDFCVDAVIVSSLIGHTLDALELAPPTIVVAHDFYPACASINPWMGRICRDCGGDAASCAVPGAPPMPFGESFARAWPALREAFVSLVRSRSLPFIVPSQSAAELWRRLDPRLGDVPIHVVPHGIQDPGPPIDWRAPEPGPPLRLVVLGRVVPNKGEALLRQAAPQLAAHASVTLLGCGPAGMRVAEALGWEAIEHYDLADLRPMLARLSPHAAILASVVPETYSYTLTELQALGVPPIATRLGAFAERIRDGEDGILVAPDGGAIVQRIAALHGDPRPLAEIAANLAHAQRPRDVAAMIADYHRLLPLSSRALARFPLREQPPTALTEAYTQLDAAYHSVGAAYQETRKAYEATQAAYQERDRQYVAAAAELERAKAELEAMRVRRWAASMVSTLRSRTRRGEPQS